MAVNKKHSRPISVADRRFRWSFRSWLLDQSERGSGVKGQVARSALIVQAMHGKGAKLIAISDHFGHGSSWVWWIPGEEGCEPSCTPAMVRAVIIEALSQGWCPDQAGADFRCLWRDPSRPHLSRI
ncbi:MAG: hypothetical protein KTR19_04935 [Hyphomicrobiales bacterium]|nr:hypothetical protein [Hyphomicrobiales bacterium]